MWFPLFVVFLAAMNGYLWLLNRRVDKLPANAAHEEKFLKDEEFELHPPEVTKE